MTPRQNIRTLNARELSQLAMNGDLDEIKKCNVSNYEIDQLISWATVGTVQTYLGSYNALMIAAAYRHFDLVKYFIEEKQANYNIKGGRLNDITALDCAKAKWWFIRPPNVLMINYLENYKRPIKQSLIFPNTTNLIQTKLSVKDTLKNAYKLEENEERAIKQTILCLINFDPSSPTINITGSDRRQCNRIFATLLWFKHLSFGLINDFDGQAIFNLIFPKGINLYGMRIIANIPGPITSTQEIERIYINDHMPVLFIRNSSLIRNILTELQELNGIEITHKIKPTIQEISLSKTLPTPTPILLDEHQAKSPIIKTTSPKTIPTLVPRKETFNKTPSNISKLTPSSTPQSFSKSSDKQSVQGKTFLESAQHHRVNQSRVRTSSENAFDQYLKAAQSGERDAVASLENLGEEMNAERQLALSHLFSTFFHNNEKATYWRNKAHEVEHFNLEI